MRPRKQGFSAEQVPVSAYGGSLTNLTDLTNNYFTAMCSGSEAGSYLKPIDFVYHSTLGLRVIKKGPYQAPQAEENARGEEGDPHRPAHLGTHGCQHASCGGRGVVFEQI